MKKIILSIILLTQFLILSSQTQQTLKYIEEEKVYRYEEVINFDTNKVTNIYDKVMIYVKQNLKPNDGTLLDGKDNKKQISMTGVVILKDIVTAKYNLTLYEPIMEYNLNIFFKEDRIKVIIDKIIIYGYMGGAKKIVDYNTLENKDSKPIDKFKIQPNEYVNKLSSEIKKILNGEDKKDDW